MSSKGKQISVIIAGATGSLGQEIVSRLVSHPDVSRVVALARYPIPVNRWTSVFPHLHISDARRYLSVVPVDWEKILADASHIPRSYVSAGVWRFDDAEAELKSFERHRKRAARSARAPKDADATYQSRSYGHTKSGSVSGTSSSGIWLSGPPQGYVKMPTGWPDGEGSLTDTQSNSGGSQSFLEELHQQEKRTINMSSTFYPTMWSSTAEGHGSRAGDTARRRWSQEFLRQLLQSSFYRSVFSGHQVAINCIGTSRVLSSAELTLVDYDLSMAFAKIVRLFNCMAHAEATEDEERLLVEMTSRGLDSVLWNEIYSACYGKSSGRYSSASLTAKKRADDKLEQSVERRESPFSRLRRCDCERATAAAAVQEPDESYAIADTARCNEEKSQWINGRQVATLRHFSQVSVRGANEHSPLPYLRTHGRRDRDILLLFNRWKDPLEFTSRRFRRSEQSTRASLPFSRPTLMSPSPPSIVPSRFGIPASLHRILFGTAPYSAGGGNHSQYNHHRLHHRGRGAQGANGDYGSDGPGAEEIARERAQVLLRRDVVKIWEHSNLTIWRSGVFQRPGRRRVIERLLSLVERPVDVRCLAECIVDDVVDSLYNTPSDQGGSREPRVGKTKVINGGSVARRTYMKALEDGLDERDTQRVLRMHK